MKYSIEEENDSPAGLSDDRLVAMDDSCAWVNAKKVAQRIERELGGYFIDDEMALRLATSDDPFAKQIGDAALLLIDRSQLPKAS